MAAKIAMSDASTKVGFLAVSAIRQKDLTSAVGGGLQHAIVMRYMLDTDQIEDGVTGAHRHTQEHRLLPGIPLWVCDSDRGHQAHRKVHAAEAAQEQEVSEAPVAASESNVPSLPKMKKTAQFVPLPSTAAGKGTPSSGQKEAKEKGKESDKAEETEDEEANQEVEERDAVQVMETKKRKRTPSSPLGAKNNIRCRVAVQTLGFVPFRNGATFNQPCIMPTFEFLSFHSLSWTIRLLRATTPIVIWYGLFEHRLVKFFAPLSLPSRCDQRINVVQDCKWYIQLWVTLGSTL